MFIPLASGLTPQAHSEALNHQIATMTFWGFIAIAIPMMLFTGAVLYFFLKKLGRIVELEVNELLRE